MFRWWSPLFVLCIVGAAGAAQARVVHYTEPHPVAPGVHKGMCHIEGPHIHAYKPHKPVLYVQIGGHYSFVGDPVEFEVEEAAADDDEPRRPRFAYHSHHPVFWVTPAGAEIEHYCYINGPHHHWYRPPPRMRFKRKGGVYWYVGARPRWYRKRWRKRRHINRHYAEVHFTRPVVTVAPPVGFISVGIGPHGRAHAYGSEGGVYVSPPRARVRVRGPGVHLRVPGVGVVFGSGGERRGRVGVRHGRHRVRVRGSRGRRGRGHARGRRGKRRRK
jgi:hypothetical protein